MNQCLLKGCVVVWLSECMTQQRSKQRKTSGMVDFSSFLCDKTKNKFSSRQKISSMYDWICVVFFDASIIILYEVYYLDQDIRLTRLWESEAMRIFKSHSDALTTAAAASRTNCWTAIMIAFLFYLHSHLYIADTLLSECVNLTERIVSFHF